MEHLDQLLSEATASIASEYFLLPIHGADPIYRERVYCYELYHQLKRLWPPPNQSLYRLSGEVDKRGHIAMTNLGIRGQKPDFLVHQPGNMEGNHTIIEVKSAPSVAHKIRKDLETLVAFRNAGYERAIYLIYGHKANQKMVARVTKFAENISNAGGIEVWLHDEQGEAAFLASVLP